MSNELAVMALAEEFHKNKAESDRLAARNKEISEQLIALAKFEGKSKTAHILNAAGIKVKVTKSETTKYDQDKLESFRQSVGNDVFFGVFKWEYKPLGKAQVDAFLNVTDSGSRSLLLGAMTTSESTRIEVEKAE